jgi:Tol biopolymer transport system component
MIKGNSSDVVQTVSPDGKYLLYGNVDILVLPLTGERKSQVYLQTKYRENEATFSPDGRWVAYDSDESGAHEIYVQGFPQHLGKWAISSAGNGTNPAWRADGKELYWVTRENTLMVTAVEPQPQGLRPGRTEVLFKMSRGAYQPARDGRRFLTYESEDVRQDWPMVLDLNWAPRLGK